jgi:hypothetical protein
MKNDDFAQYAKLGYTISLFHLIRETYLINDKKIGEKDICIYAQTGKKIY